ncbi:MAG: hypothetical protein NC310_09000 [Roseburia sp.]|nr:hypothetical protein [Anaeroplasma bactoclasticum]MCM1197186.1 hypothetical protein [Roseburia sp.]MCM1556342.1 hypothetical protein [Anaeroplasma bactoclasticum]
MRKLAAPKIDRFKHYNYKSIIVDQKTIAILDDMFDCLISNIKQASKGEDYYFSFYYEAKKGSIKDFYSYEECVDYYEISTYEEYQKLWEEEYPKESYWYYFEFRKVIYNNKKYYIIAINNHIILNVDPLNARGWEENKEELVSFTYEIVKDFVRLAKETDYNDYVQTNLDYELREGILLLKDFWEIEPEQKKNYFSQLSSIDIHDFIKRAKSQSNEQLSLIKDMTSSKYYEICKLAYNAIGKGDNNITPKELFYKNADGRDQGLCKIDEHSLEAFNNWYKESKHHFDHTFEILPGRSFYRADLYIIDKDDGYYLGLSGNNFWTCLDVIKIYMALIKNNIPVILYDVELITKRLVGDSYLAIISKGKTTYGYHNVLGYSLIDSLELPEEKRNLYIEKTIWEELPKIELRKQKCSTR